MADRDALQALIQAEGGNFALAASDWRYYAEKLRKARCDIDAAEIAPYLALDNMIAASFDTAHRLFGLSFRERHDVPVWHPDVRVWEVMGPSGNFQGLFYGDYFARASKRSGAWMTTLRTQDKITAGGADGGPDEDVRPLVINVMNFVKGAPGEPALLSFDDARTLFHEFGHGLHGLLSDVTFPMISCTRVATDFVELPSQLYEHWLEQPDVLRRFARHYRTGEPMPEDLLARLIAARSFNQGFATVEYIASAMVDLAFHLAPDAGKHRPGEIRGRCFGANRHAGRNRHAPPVAAFPARVLRRRLCGRLLQLYVVGSARRRRLRGIPGGRRRVRPRHRGTAARQYSRGGRLARSGRRLPGLPGAAADPGRAPAQARLCRGRRLKAAQIDTAVILSLSDAQNWTWGLSLIFLTVMIHAVGLVLTAIVGLRVRLWLQPRNLGLRIWLRSSSA